MSSTMIEWVMLFAGFYFLHTLFLDFINSLDILSD